jgi:hypothetical protein
LRKKINKSILLNSLDLSLLENNDRTSATKCKGYNKSGKLYFFNYEDVYDHNISVVKNVLTATHTKYKVGKDFSTCTPLFHEVVSSEDIVLTELEFKSGSGSRINDRTRIRDIIFFFKY